MYDLEIWNCTEPHKISIGQAQQQAGRQWQLSSTPKLTGIIEITISEFLDDGRSNLSHNRRSTKYGQ